MPNLVGALMALVALAASILASVGPLDCLLRGLIAYLVGRFATQLWYIFFTIRVERGKEGTGVTPVALPVKADIAEESVQEASAA